MRIYLPATSVLLRRLADGVDLVDAPLTAFAVTPGIRDWYQYDDVEELEYAASGQAVRASLRLIDGDPSAARRRVVLAFDVADSSVMVRDDVDRGAVRIAVALTGSALAAIHVDDIDAEPAVARAAANVLEADLGSTVSQDIVDDAEGFELAWYAPQELAEALATVENGGADPERAVSPPTASDPD